MKKLLVLLLTMFVLVFPKKSNAYSFINFTPVNFAYFQSFTAGQEKMRVVVKCYTGRNFTGNTKIKNLDLAIGTSSKRFTYDDDRDCLSLKIIGIGIDTSGSWHNILTSGNYVFQNSFSIAVGQHSQAVGETQTYGNPSNGGTITQLINHLEPPTVVTNTNNISQRSDVIGWMNDGFPSQLDCQPAGINVNEVTSNESDYHPDGSGAVITNATRSLNFDVAGFCYNQYDQSGYTNNTVSFWFGDRSDTGNSLLDIASSHYWTLTVSKGMSLILPQNNLTDQEEKQILRNIENAINNSSTAGVVNAINNQTTQQQTIANQQEQAAQQRQEELLNDNTQDGQRDLTNFINNFDDGADPTLSSIITKPLEFIQSLTTTACTPLTLPIPIINTNLTLPCGRAYVNQFAPQLIALWDTIVVGLLAYKMGTDLYVRIHEFKNPDNDGNVTPLEL